MEYAVFYRVQSNDDALWSTAVAADHYSTRQSPQQTTTISTTPDHELPMHRSQLCQRCQGMALHYTSQTKNLGSEKAGLDQSQETSPDQIHQQGDSTLSASHDASRGQQLLRPISEKTKRYYSERRTRRERPSATCKKIEEIRFPR